MSRKSLLLVPGLLTAALLLGSFPAWGAEAAPVKVWETQP
jgi:hypothetical protein